MRGSTHKAALAAIAVVVLALVLAACGGSDSSSSGESSAAGESTATSETASSEGGSSGSAAAAKQAIAPYIGQPSAFPVTENLKEVPKGATIDYVDCGTPICALFWQILGPAADTMGVNLERVKAGSAANTVSAAFDTVVAKQPAGVIVGSITMQLWSKQLKELQDAGIPVITTGITEAEEFGIEAPQASNNSSELEGRLMADYAVAAMATGEETNAVFYETPELTFTKVVGEAFAEELEKICSGCSVRTGQVGVAELGNTAPNTVVSDLQANPETNLAVFGTNEVSAGLPAALQAAGIEVETLGNSPGPTELQYLKEGKQTAALGFDLPVLTWTLLDQTARQIVGQKLTGPESEGIPVLQFLTQKDIVFDPSKGWTGYPDFAERFAKLWGVGG
jgi:ribose transport system substrate-binding protein